MTFSAQYAHEMFSYDPETGSLTWLSRPLSHFPDAGYHRRVNTRYAGKPAGRKVRADGYTDVTVARKQYLAHRVIWLMHFGEWPNGFIDHINGDRLDNRLENLRVVTPAENQHNRAKNRNNTSGVSGVYFQQGRWIATIGRAPAVHLGRFVAREDAIAARKAAEADRGYHPNHGRAA